MSEVKIVILGIRKNDFKANETLNHLKELGFMNVEIFWGATLEETPEVKLPSAICMYNAKKILDMNRDLEKIIYCEDDVRIFDPIALKEYISSVKEGIHRLVYLDIPVRKDHNYKEPHYKLGTQMILFDNKHINELADIKFNKGWDTWLNKEYINHFPEPTGFEYVYEEGTTLHDHHRKSDYIRSREFDKKVGLIHYVFLDVGLKDLSEREDWLENMKINKELNPNYTFKLWRDKEVNELINNDYPQYKEIIKDFRHKFYLIDFCRYLILIKEGGMYMDLDLRCKKPLPSITMLKNNILGNSYTKKGINNNLIYFKDNQNNKKLLDFCLNEVKRIEENKLYDKWKGRHLLNSVGAYMFKRFCKRNNIESDLIFEEYFLDGECGSWIEAGVCKNYLKKTNDGKPPIINV